MFLTIQNFISLFLFTITIFITYYFLTKPKAHNLNKVVPSFYNLNKAMPSFYNLHFNKPKILIFPLIAIIVGVFIQEQAGINILCILAINIFSILIFFLFYKTTKHSVSIFISYLLIIFSIGSLSLSLSKSLYFIQQKKFLKNKSYLKAIVLEKTSLQKSFYKERFLIKTPHKILCYSAKQTNILPGDIIVIKNFSSKKTYHPSFKRYLLKNNILMSIFIKKYQCKIVSKQRNFLKEKRIKLFKSLKEKIPERTFMFFSKIFLGNKDSKKFPQRNNFAFWGILHHLARSGLHIAIFVIIWATILSKTPMPFLLRHIIIILLCLIYTAFSWISLSYLRAISLFLLYEIGKIFNKQTNVFYLLFAVTTFVLCFNPIQIFSLDFQLSFGLSIALAFTFT